MLGELCVDQGVDFRLVEDDGVPVIVAMGTNDRKLNHLVTITGAPEKLETMRYAMILLIRLQWGAAESEPGDETTSAAGMGRMVCGRTQARMRLLFGAVECTGIWYDL